MGIETLREGSYLSRRSWNSGVRCFLCVLTIVPLMPGRVGENGTSMIRHIVLFTAKNKAHIDQIVEGLSILTTIPHARRLEIARNRKTDQLGNDIDVVVYGEFDNETEFTAYKAHDLYQESIRRVRPLRELRFAANYNASADTRFTSTAATDPVAGGTVSTRKG